MQEIELDHDNKKWRERVCGKNRLLLPYLEKAIERITKESRAALDEAHQHESLEIRNVNVWLRDIEFYVGGELPITAGDMEIRSYAEKMADRLCRDFYQNRKDLGLSADDCIDILVSEVVRCDLDPPSGLGDDKKDLTQDQKASAIARIFNPLWWRRKVRKLCVVKTERLVRECGGVNMQAGVYCSEFSVKRRLKQKKRNQELLENMVAENDQGQAFIVADVAALGVSNPHIRANEIMARAGGFDRLALASDSYDCHFLTITCPSKYHAFHHWGGQNTKWNHSDPKQAQDYLCGVWSRVRAAWDREDIKAFGIRTCEPHHDGTPHWHMQLWFEKGKAERAIKIYEDHACLEDSYELEQAKEGNAIRFKALKMDPARGSATGYILKYVLKNINGRIEYDKTRDFGEPEEMATRIEAWAGVWGIRQFQQIGGPSVTVWRELRRLKEMEGVSNEDFEAIRAAADAGDWNEFCVLMGGPLAPRSEHPIRAYMIVKSELNQYGEQILKIIGLVWDDRFAVPTRLFEWTVRMVSSDREREAIRACGPPLAA
jgi:hypothetical protein